mmetsp:Transcript_39327/g.66045  ORF Transcript_39327/g.66045 Transcript_39327/m.66045 type:complete len:104 (+) Transcript_39327:460-771(+)
MGQREWVVDLDCPPPGEATTGEDAWPSIGSVRRGSGKKRKQCARKMKCGGAEIQLRLAKAAAAWSGVDVARRSVRTGGMEWEDDAKRQTSGDAFRVEFEDDPT